MSDVAGSFPSQANMLDAIERRMADPLPISDPRFDLAAAIRAMIDELMSSTAADAELHEAAELTRRAAMLLRGESHGRGYLGVAEGSLAIGSGSFIDYSPLIGPLNPLAPPISVRIDDDGNVVGTCTYGAAYEGPPGCLHGGLIAAGFDEILGFAQAASGMPGMTGRLSISYRSPTPLFEEVRFVGRLDHIEGRKIYTVGTLSAGDRLCAEAEGLFISMKPEVFGRLIEKRLERQDDPGAAPDTAPVTGPG